jgi:hypothetical protein
MSMFFGKVRRTRLPICETAVSEFMACFLGWAVANYWQHGLARLFANEHTHSIRNYQKMRDSIHHLQFPLPCSASPHFRCHGSRGLHTGILVADSHADGARIVRIIRTQKFPTSSCNEYSSTLNSGSRSQPVIFIHFRKQAIVFRPDDLVTFAGAFLQSGPVMHADMSTMTTYQPRMPELRGRLRDPLATHAERTGNQFLCYDQFI